MSDTRVRISRRGFLGGGRGLHNNDLVVTVQGAPAYERHFAGHLENGRSSRTGPDQ